jgi:hypothetical protein
VAAAPVAADTKREHVGMFDEQQQVADAMRPPVFHEGALQREGFWIRHQTETPDFDRPTHLRSAQR